MFKHDFQVFKILVRVKATCMFARMSRQTNGSKDKTLIDQIAFVAVH